MKSSEDNFYLHCPTFLLIKTLQSPSSRTKLYSFHCTCMMDVNKIQKYATAVSIQHTAQLLPLKQTNCLVGTMQLVSTMLAILQKPSLLAVFSGHVCLI